MKYKNLIIFLILFYTYSANGQVGGLRSFDFLNIPGDARTTALGGVNVSMAGGDINAMALNPSLLDSSMVNSISLSYLSYLGGVKFSNLSYANHHKIIGTWGINLKYINYGNIESFDATGFPLGTFNSNEFVVGLTNSHSTGLFRLGGTLKFAYSSITGYQSSAILVDLAGNFTHPDKDLVVGLVVKNLGLVLQDYTITSETNLPFDVQLGASYKPEHMPFRLSVTAYNLYRADIAYFNPNGENQDLEDAPGFSDKLFRHLIFAAEFVPTANFNIRLGYNYMMRKELRLFEISGGAGFSFGLMFKVNAFEFAYGKSFYHVAGSTNHLTVSSNFNRLLHRTKKIENL